MRVALIINRSAGTFRRLPADDTAERLARILADHGHGVHTDICDRRDLAERVTQAAASNDIDWVVVGGGDGTILTAILAGLGRDKPLGLLPLGTLNLLAHDLRLPADPFLAAHAIADGHVAAIDLAEVNGLPFAIWASLGMHPWVVHQRDKLQAGGLHKWPAFAWAALRALKRYPLMRVTLSVGEQTMTVTTPILVISNNAWKEIRLPPERASLDRGELVVHVVRTNSRLGLVWLGLNALAGRWKVQRLLETHAATEVRVVGRKRRAILSLDGELAVLRTPLVFRNHAKGLRVVMPGPAPSASESPRP